MSLFCLKYLSEKQRDAWRMRYQYGWRMKRIALKLKMTESGVSKMLARAQRYAGLPKARVSILRTKPRRVHCLYLSEVLEEY